MTEKNRLVDLVRDKDWPGVIETLFNLCDDVAAGEVMEDRIKELTFVPCHLLILVEIAKRKQAYSDPGRKLSKVINEMLPNVIKKLLTETSTRTMAIKDIAEGILQASEELEVETERKPKSQSDKRRREELMEDTENLLVAYAERINQPEGQGVRFFPPPLLSFLNATIGQAKQKLDKLKMNGNVELNTNVITTKLDNILEQIHKTFEQRVQLTSGQSSTEAISGTAQSAPSGGEIPFYFLSPTGEDVRRILSFESNRQVNTGISPYLLRDAMKMDSGDLESDFDVQILAMSPSYDTTIMEITNVYLEFELQKEMALYQCKDNKKRAAKAKMSPYGGVLTLTMSSIQWVLRLSSQEDEKRSFVIPFGSIVAWYLPDRADRFLMVQTQDMNYRFSPIEENTAKNVWNFLEKFVGKEASQSDPRMIEKAQLMQASKMRKLQKKAAKRVDEIIATQKFPSEDEVGTLCSRCLEKFFKKVGAASAREIERTLEKATEALCGFDTGIEDLVGGEGRKQSSNTQKHNVLLLEAMRKFCSRKAEYVSIVLEKVEMLRTRRDQENTNLSEFMELFTRDDAVLITNGLKSQAAQIRKKLFSVGISGEEGSGNQSGSWSYANYSLDQIRRIIARDDQDIIDDARCPHAKPFREYLECMYPEKLEFLDIEYELTDGLEMLAEKCRSEMTPESILRVRKSDVNT